MQLKFLQHISAIIFLSVATTALATQFPTLDPAYSQQIYTATSPVVGVPGAWTFSGDMLTRQGSTIYELSSTPNVTMFSTNIHGVVATHNVPGLSSGGVGFTNGLNGYIYANGNTGLQRIDPTNWSTPAVTVTSSPGLYGITTLPDGRIAYSDGTNNSNVWLYDPSNNTNTHIFSVANLIDGMVSGPTGDIALTNHNSPFMIQIIDSSGNLVNSFSTGTHAPDGMAFADSLADNILYSNNNDGTISKYTFTTPGYLGTPTISLIASGSQAYGDLATVGPDCAFYVTQFDNGGQNGSTAGIGTHWDDNVTTTTDPSIIRIGGGVGRDGLPVPCEFYSPIMGGVPVPEPASVALLLAGAVATFGRRSRR